MWLQQSKCRGDRLLRHNPMSNTPTNINLVNATNNCSTATLSRVTPVSHYSQPHPVTGHSRRLWHLPLHRSSLYDKPDTGCPCPQEASGWTVPIDEDNAAATTVLLNAPWWGGSAVSSTVETPDAKLLVKAVDQPLIAENLIRSSQTGLPETETGLP